MQEGTASYEPVKHSLDTYIEVPFWIPSCEHSKGPVGLPIRSLEQPARWCLTALTRLPGIVRLHADCCRNAVRVSIGVTNAQSNYKVIVRLILLAIFRVRLSLS